MLAILVSCYLTYGGELTGKRGNNGPICSLPPPSHMKWGSRGLNWWAGRGNPHHPIPGLNWWAGKGEGRGKPPSKPYLEATGKAGAGASYTCNVIPLDCQAEESQPEFIFQIDFWDLLGA